MNLSLFDFKINEIIAGKIIKLESTGVIVDFNNNKITDVPLKELSLADLQFPKEAVKLNEIREFLIVGNYDGKGKFFYSNCSPETLKNSIRLEESAYKYAQYITKQKGQDLSKEKFLIHTQISDKLAGGVSVKICWFVISQEHPPTVFFSIRELEIGQIVCGTVRGIKPYGLYVELDDIRALLRTSTNSNLSVKNSQQVFQVNDRLQAKLVELDIKRGLAIIESV